MQGFEEFVFITSRLKTDSRRAVTEIRSLIRSNVPGEEKCLCVEEGMQSACFRDIV